VDIGDEIYTTNCSDCHFAGGTDEHADNKAVKKH
jgi:mono/diheme cytochrome c family protein